MDVNKENENVGSGVLFPYGTDDMLDMDFNPYDDSYTLGGDLESFGVNPPEQIICQPESEHPQGLGDIGIGHPEDEIRDDLFSGYEEEGCGSGRVGEEVQPVYFFADATIQRLFDINKLIFNSINAMYQIEEQASAQDIEMRACSEEAMARFQMGEFQRVKAVTIQPPQDCNEVSCGNAGYGVRASSGLKKGKHPGKKFQERHRASIVGTASTLKVQPIPPNSKKYSGRKTSKKASAPLAVLRYPGRRDSIY